MSRPAPVLVPQGRHDQQVANRLSKGPCASGSSFWLHPLLMPVRAARLSGWRVKAPGFTAAPVPGRRIAMAIDQSARPPRRGAADGTASWCRLGRGAVRARGGSRWQWRPVGALRAPDRRRSDRCADAASTGGEQFNPPADAAGAGSISARAAVRRWLGAALPQGRKGRIEQSQLFFGHAHLRRREVVQQGRDQRLTGADERRALASAKVERRAGMQLGHPGASA